MTNIKLIKIIIVQSHFQREWMELGLLVLQNPCTTEENEHFGV